MGWTSRWWGLAGVKQDMGTGVARARFFFPVCPGTGFAIDVAPASLCQAGLEVLVKVVVAIIFGYLVLLVIIA